MATEDLNITDDAEMAECDGDKVVTMMDVLQEQQEFEEDANAVLGASDDKNCTYSKGYVKRQALYACLSCCPEAKEDPTKRAGVCLACSLSCHENHELVELYTKRNFRCDCGNPNFNSHPCQFTPSKPDFNDDNIYNQNFSGLYCICQKPYPDPDATFEDDMIQCIVCEDWLHASHLDTTVPGSDQYAEMICKACMEKNDFLNDYVEFAVNYDMGDIDISNVNGAEDSLCNGDDKTTNGDDKITNGDDKITNGDDKITNEDDKITNGDDKITNADDKITNGDVDVPTTPADEETITNSADNADKICDTKDAEVSKDEHAENTTDETAENASNMDVDGDTIKKQDESNETDDKNVENKIDSSTEGNNKDITDESDTTTNIEKAPNDDNNTLEKDSEVSDEKAVEDSDKPESKTETETSEILTKDVKENADIASDPVMEAIDELLATEPKEAKPVDEKQENESSDNKPDDKTEDNVNDVDGGNVENQNDALSSENKDDNAVESAPKAAETETDMAEEKQVDNVVPDDEISPPVEPAKDETVASGEPEVNGTESTTNECKRKLDDSMEGECPKKAKLSPDCLRPKGVKRKHKGATFWSSTFRQKLCTCGDCLSMYKDLNVLFLTDLEDTVFAYESLGKSNVDSGSSQYEKGMQALSSLDRVQQINALTEYNKMRDKLLDFLKSFKERKEVVKEDDIKAFFAGMKPQREPDGVYFCR